MKQEDFYNYCGIAKKWHKPTLEDYKNDTAGDKGIKTVKKYLTDPKKYYEEGRGLYMYGENGVGKSMLMNCAFKELLEQRFTVRIITINSLVNRYTKSWYDQEAESLFNKEIMKVQFLGIDDVGKEFKVPRKLGDKEDTRVNDRIVTQVLDMVFRYRCQTLRPTWVTSNLPPAKLGEIYSPDIASLAGEMFVLTKVVGSDYRKQTLKRTEL